MITAKELEFLKESNAIEHEYSDIALEDAKAAWKFAKLHIKRCNIIDIRFVKDIHKILMRRLNPRISGQLRLCNVRVGNRICLQYQLVEETLTEHCKCQPHVRLPNNNEGAIKTWHIKFEEIHPFEDGNGRTGRIIMNIQRYKMDLPILVIHEGNEQQEYYKWFKNL